MTDLSSYHAYLYQTFLRQLVSRNLPLANLSQFIKLTLSFAKVCSIKHIFFPVTYTYQYLPQNYLCTINIISINVISINLVSRQLIPLKLNSVKLTCIKLTFTELSTKLHPLCDARSNTLLPNLHSLNLPLANMTLSNLPRSKWTVSNLPCLSIKLNSIKFTPHQTQTYLCQTGPCSIFSHQICLYQTCRCRTSLHPACLSCVVLIYLCLVFFDLIQPIPLPTLNILNYAISLPSILVYRKK